MPYVRDSFWRGRTWDTIEQMQAAAIGWCATPTGNRSHRALEGASPNPNPVDPRGRLGYVSALEAEYGDPMHLSLSDYFLWERGHELRHEYVSGVIYAMTGASATHNQLAVKLVTMLWPAANNAGCRVTQSDMALRIESVDSVYYPDVMVACEPLDDEYLETAPCLVIEILSPSTQGRDRTTKLGHYCTMPSLQVYLMVSSNPADPFVLEHRRAGDIWQHRLLRSDDEIRLACPPITFVVKDLYDGLPPKP